MVFQGTKGLKVFIIESKKPRAQAEMATLKQMLSLNLRETGGDTMEKLLRTTGWAQRSEEIPPLQARPSYPTLTHTKANQIISSKLNRLVSPKTSKAFCHSEALAQELLTVLMVTAVASGMCSFCNFYQSFRHVQPVQAIFFVTLNHEFFAFSGNSRATSKFSSRRSRRFSMACCQWLSRSRALSSKFRCTTLLRRPSASAKSPSPAL